jgi:hypothetical protein
LNSRPGGHGLAGPEHSRSRKQRRQQQRRARCACVPQPVNGFLESVFIARSIGQEPPSLAESLSDEAKTAKQATKPMPSLIEPRQNVCKKSAQEI